MIRQLLLFTGSSHPRLAQGISAQLGVPLGRQQINRFPDGEFSVEIQEDVRGRDVFVLQSIAVDPNQYLVELLILIDALKREGAQRIIAIIPYFGYCRQDRKDKPGVAITAKLIANLLTTAGVTHLITCDLHADQIEGFFEIPVTHLRCQKLLADSARNTFGENSVVVAPDIGSIKIAEAMARLLKVDLVVINKQRITPFEVKARLIGDVTGKNVLIVDDLCSTGATLVAAAHLCRDSGAKKIGAAITHGLFVAGALEKIASSALEAVWVTNTVPLPPHPWPKITPLFIESVLAQLMTNLLDQPR